MATSWLSSLALILDNNDEVVTTMATPLSQRTGWIRFSGWVLSIDNGVPPA